MRVAVAGAGVGGLTLAAALRERGFEVAVFEQAPRLREQGGGVTLYTNAVAALREMGLRGVLHGIAEPAQRMVALSASGRQLAEASLRKTSERYSAPTVNVHRGELLSALREAVGEGAVTFGARCVGFEQEAEGVRLGFADGTERRADLLVAADGAGSVIRKAIHGEDSDGEGRRWSGWQGVALSIPVGLAEGACTFVLSGRAVAGLLTLSGGRAHWFMDDPFSSRRPTGAARDHSSSETLAEVVGGWPAVVREAVAATPPEAVSYDTVRDLIPPRRSPRPWGVGRVTLLGDAAHPMLPSLGQGACQALEDAAALVRCLKPLESGAGVEDALREYERQRAPRAAAFVRGSRWSSEFRSRFPAALRDPLLRAIPPGLLSVTFGRSIRPVRAGR